MVMRQIVIGGVEVVTALAAAPLLAGISAWTKARLSGKTGAGPLQPYRLIGKLLKKEGLSPSAASALFWLAPLVGTAAVVAALSSVPIDSGVIFPWSDAVIVAYLLMFAAALSMLAALDTGTAFGGMGASREAMIAALSEPTLMLVLLGITASAGTTDLSKALPAFAARSLLSPAPWILGTALLLVALAENARLPFDNPTTHLELTMVHEAMVLEHSGPQFALITYQSAAKLALFWLLAWAIFFPISLATAGWLALPLGALLIVAKLAVGGLALGAMETVVVKIRIFRAPDLLAVAFALAVFGLMMGMVTR